MTVVARMLAYAVVCSTAIGGTLTAAALVLAPAAIERLPETSKAEPSARIETWRDRQAVAMPDAPRPHGPALSPDEILALSSARRGSAEPVMRVPIMAMTESASPPPRARSDGHSSGMAVRDAPRMERGSSSPHAYARTARERYAPERNY